jgi:hypothetical protein
MVADNCDNSQRDGSHFRPAIIRHRIAFELGAELLGNSNAINLYCHKANDQVRITALGGGCLAEVIR